MNKYLFGLSAIIFSGCVMADGPRVGVEFETENDNRSGVKNQALTVIPGWDFASENLINRVELLIERNRDLTADATGVYPKENKLFLRLRHNGNLSQDFGYYIRGGIGRAFNSEADYNFYYIEPAVKYKQNPKLSWVMAYRDIHALDKTTGKNVGKALFGPSYDFDKNNGVELRYVKGSGDKDVTAWIFEYVHKF